MVHKNISKNPFQGSLPVFICISVSYVQYPEMASALRVEVAGHLLYGGMRFYCFTKEVVLMPDAVRKRTT